MSRPKDSVEAIEKVLGEPASAEFTENAWKIRTNLIFASVVAIAVVFGDLHIGADSQIFGLKFKGLTDTLLTNGLIGVVGYLLLHFLWAAWDALLEWRLRITGTRVAFVTTARMSSVHGDYPGDPRQSTLYHWWKEEARKIGNLRAQLDDVKQRLHDWESRLKSEFTTGPNAMNIVNATSLIANVREAITRLDQSVKEVGDVIEAGRVPTSLARFDRGTHCSCAARISDGSSSTFSRLSSPVLTRSHCCWQDEA